AYALYQAGLSLARATGDARGVCYALASLGEAALRRGDHIEARRFAEECLALCRQIGERFLLGYALECAGEVATAEGDYSRARARLRESLNLHQDVGNRAGAADTLESIAALAATETESEHAVQLAGAAASLRAQVGAALSPMRRTARDRWLVPLGN